MFAAFSRRLRTTLPFLFVIALTACGGGGGALPSTSAKAGPIPLTVVSQSGSNITLTGNVVAIKSSTEFQIQGGSGVGYLNIYTTSSTIISGPAPFVGENVEVTGTGSVSTSVTATQVWQISSTPIPSSTPSPAASPTGSTISLPAGVFMQTGQIAAIVSSTKLEINGGAGCGYMYVYTSSSTNVWGAASPQVGQYGEFIGTGTKCSSLNASSMILSSAPIPSASTSGTIAAATAYGFTLNTGSSTLPIALISSTTVSGGMLTVGDSVSVGGMGSASSAIGATQVTITGTPAPSPAPTASPTPAPPGAAIPLPTGVFAQTGQVAAILSSTKISVNAGSGCGYMYVYTSSSTNMWGGSAPQVGQYGEFVGTGTKCSSQNATAITLSPSAITSTTVSGTVSAQTQYGFTLDTASGPVPVVLTSSTVVYGATLCVGSAVSVTGNGATSSALTATQIAVQPPPTPTPSGTPSPTPGPIGTTHVMTADVLYGYGGTPTTTSLSSVAPYVTWVQTDPSYAAQIRAAGIKVDIYTNFWRNYGTDNPIVGYTDLEPGGIHAAAEATDCSSNVIYDSAYGGGYEADPRTSAALGHAQTVVNYRLNEFGSNYDAVFADDSGAVWGITLPCNYDESTYDAAVNSVHSSLALPMWVNALGAPPNPASGVDLVQPSNVLGAMCEICYAGNGSNGDYIQTGTSWQNVENAEIGVVSQRKVFWDYARATGDPSAETALRTYIYASLLLSYDPSYVMLQEAFQSATGFPVMPESGLVALNPVTTATDVSGYQASGGAYFREFGACYYQGNFVSNCAVAVNPGAGTVPVPSTSYAHSLVLSGGGVLDGGTAAFNGPAISSLAPGSAVILFP